MSASLVGSEMCIRDSETPEARNGDRSVRTPPRQLVRVGSALRVPALRTCLLYTSDAADDM
eukprot:14582327-Alexandrium_andersonii.AAC.1